MHPDPDDVQGRFQAVRDSLDPDTILDELARYLPTDDVPEFNLGDFADWLSRMYDL